MTAVGFFKLCTEKRCGVDIENVVIRKFFSVKLLEIGVELSVQGRLIDEDFSP